MYSEKHSVKSTIKHPKSFHQKMSEIPLDFYLDSPKYPVGYCSHCKRSENQNMIEVLLSENENIKSQNNFLQQEINRIKAKERELMETIHEYQSIMSILNSKNSQLHNDICSITLKATNKMDKLKSTLQNRNKERLTAPSQYLQSEDSINTPQPNISLSKTLNSVLSKNNKENELGTTDLYGSFKRHRIPKQRYLTECDHQFERLLQECKQEQDPKIKKLLRKQLVNMTYQNSAIIGYSS